MDSKLKEMSNVHWYEGIGKHKCGYCKQENTSTSNGMWAHWLTVQDYQSLIDRGWRRSGMYCYKPIMEETCCPQYTIRCDVTKFTLSKSQKKVIKKFNKFLESDNLVQNDNCATEDRHDTQEISIRENPHTSMKNFDFRSIQMEHTEDGGGSQKSRFSIKEKTSENHQGKSDGREECFEVPGDKNYSKKQFKGGVGADIEKPPRKKAKLLRIERKQEKLALKGLTIEQKTSSGQKSVEEFLEEMPLNAKNSLKIRLVPISDPEGEWLEYEEVEFQLYKRYQMIIHNDPASKVKMSSFQSFLVESPLQPQKVSDAIEGPGYGSFHQQYWLNDSLIAVGVLDILPKCVSSVYFFYDPDYRSLTLGTYGSLREIQLARSLHENLPDLANYYMGFYIHSCPKMRYKGKLSPSFLLCPETYGWTPIERCLPTLDRTKYARLSEDADASDADAPSADAVASMKIVYKRRLMSLGEMRRRSGVPRAFGDVGRLVGRRACESLLFWTS